MTTQTLPARSSARPARRPVPRHASGPNPLVAFVVSLAILGGGALAGLDWLDATCGTEPSLAAVCTATGR